jgi:hypothetical protein
MADVHFKEMTVADRAKDSKANSTSDTVQSSPRDINDIVGAGKWSFPNSAPDPGKGLHRDRVDIEEPPHKDMIEQAHHMKMSYDAAIQVKPDFKGKTTRCTATGCYQILKERKRTAELYQKKCGRYEKSSMSTPVPIIEYPGAIGKSLEMRFPPKKTSMSFERGLETAATRREHLNASLSPANKKIPAITADAKQDLAFCSHLSNEQDDTFVQHLEFVRFKSPAPGNLIVHGMDMKYKSDSTSVLSALFWKSYQILSDGNIVLTHSIGLSTAGRNQDNDHLKGSSGLFRSLCAQLIAYEDVGTQLSLRWLTNRRLQEAGTKKNARLSLASFFRDLIFDVAESAAKQGIKRSVRLIIDGIDRIEKDKTLWDVVTVFRSVADEIDFGPLGKHLTFKYILLHPQISHLAVELHPNERHLFLGRKPESPEPKAKAKARSEKGKGKAKREKIDLLDKGLDDEEELEEDDDKDILLKPQELTHHLVRTQVVLDPKLEAQMKSMFEEYMSAIHFQQHLRTKANTAPPEGHAIHMKYFLVGDGLDPDMPKGKVAPSTLRVWTPEPPPLQYKEELSSPEARNDALMEALQNCNLPYLIDNEAHYDPKRVQEYLKQDTNAQISSIALEHPEMVHFSKVLTGGLIIHGMSTSYVKTTQHPVTPFVGLLSGFSAANPDTMRLTYAAGLDLLNDPAAMTKTTSMSGVPACVRQLCLQLIEQPLVRKHGLKLYFLNDSDYQVNTKKGSLPWLLTLFRSLVLDVAYLVYEKEEVKQQTIELIIDGTDWLERDDGLQFNHMTKFFRQLSREMYCSQTRSYVRFKYMLIHPKICEVTVGKPDILERHLLWRLWQLDRPKSDSTGLNLDPRDQQSHSKPSRQEQIEHVADALRFMTDDDPSKDDIKKLFSDHDQNLKVLEDLTKVEWGLIAAFPEYTNGYLPRIWSSSRKALLIPHAPEFDTSGKRRHQLEMALNVGFRSSSRAALAKHDRRICAAQYIDESVQLVLDLLLLHPYMLEFRKGWIHGLVIHDDIIPGKVIPFSGELGDRTLAAFINLYYFEESRHGTIVLTHSMAVYAAKRGVDERRDGAGILRSLCCQLVDNAFRKYKKPMDLEWMDAALRLRLEDCELPFLCRVFRDLLCDLATYLVKSGKPKEKVIAIVDCSEYEGSPDVDLADVVNAFRFILNEAAVCELGKLIDFNYVLLRPVMEPYLIYPTDRHLFLEELMDEVPGHGDAELEYDDEALETLVEAEYEE